MAPGICYICSRDQRVKMPPDNLGGGDKFFGIGFIIMARVEGHDYFSTEITTE